jgi:hypothetical protein
LGFPDHYSSSLPISDRHLDTRSDLVTVKMPKEDPLPFWRVNVPQAQWSAECPDFLRGISEKDQRIIGTPDEEYALLTWLEVRELVSTIAQPHPGRASTDGSRQESIASISFIANRLSCGVTGRLHTGW